MARSQLPLPFSPVRNSELFSNHWLENRLPLEPEWQELRHEAADVLDALVATWRVQRTRVEQYGGEPALEQGFIQPVLQALGWKLIYQTHLRGRKPDYALFLDDGALDRALAAGRQTPEFWDHAVMVSDAKAWHVSLDRPTIINQQREYPPEQIEWYLTNSQRDYAILTNGRFWRLIPRVHEGGQPRFQTYLECDLPKLLESRLNRPDALFDDWADYDDFLRFYFFFSPVAHRAVGDRATLIDRARKGSNEYRLGVGEGLKQRVFDALAYCIEGFLSHSPNGLSPEHDLELCRQQSFTLLYRLLFILFAEDRKLLPYRINSSYTANRSLGRFREEIAAKLDRIAQGRDVDYPLAEKTLWPDLLTLFDLIDSGASRYGVPAYNGGLFDAEVHPFLNAKVLPDRYLARVIDQLGRAPDPKHLDLGLFRVDYRDLAIQHLGNVYEGLLELRPHFATEDMVVLRNRASERKEEKIVPASAAAELGWEFTDRSYRKGSVYLLTEKGERRVTGSYYTPNHIVDYIVEKTFGPICDRIDRQLAGEIGEIDAEHRRARGQRREELAARLESLRSDFDDRVLRLRVVDPAMGSGHFLIRACQFLAEQIATNPNAKDPVAAQVHGDEPTLVYWKRRVVERCLFGVDRNLMAVELAKLALWLETVAVNQPLTFLDHHLRHGDSLVGASVTDLGGLPGIPLMANLFEQQVKSRLPALLETLTLIRKMPSDTLQQVKEKDKLFRKTFEPVRTPFRQVAHVWASTFFVTREQQVSTDQYRALLEALDKPNKLKALLEQEPYKTALAACGDAGVVAFHWELEFPEVFFGEAGIRSDAGFDAVIGNPPYDVLSEKESGRDLSQFKDFLENTPIYEPSFVGKNNLYKLFICRALGLLAEGGRLGFITPMAVLGDEGASEIRRQILKVGAFSAIEVFPQKDDPLRRVFREAKLSTAVFIIQRTSRPDEQQLSFSSRIHATDAIDIGSPALTMSSPDIPLYDPANLTIVSCSNADWELAKRITGTGRLKRLGGFAECSQGEVNETVARGKGQLADGPARGKLVVRGANICLYTLRLASQGSDLYVDVPRFLSGKGPNTKAFHYRHPRVGVQESSPQNNFRRIIASYIAAGEFCNHKVNYFSEAKSMIPLELILALLNSKLSDWYFRLGSTNAAVSHYQLHNLPCPSFADKQTAAEQTMQEKALAALRAGKLAEVPSILAPGMATPAFSPAVRQAIIEAVKRIIAIESDRGEISRVERSALAPAAQPYQDLIDRLLYRLAGLTDAEADALERRLETML
jgi:hypothetical protein